MSITTYTYKSVDELELLADVYRPPDNLSRPGVLYIHGGGLMMGRRDGGSPSFIDRLLREGYIYVSVDYRLAPETKLAAIAEDVRDAVAWVRAMGPDLFQADPRRIAVAGGSAGAMLTLLAGTMVSPPPQALVSFYGYGDNIDKWDDDDAPGAPPEMSEEEARAAVSGPPVANSGPFDVGRSAFYQYSRIQRYWTKEVTGLDPKTEREALLALCPVMNVTKDYLPTMLLHGDKDQTVPLRQSIRMARALKELGVDHELIIVPGADHGFDYADPNDTSVLDINAILDRVMAFLRRHLGPGVARVS